MALSLEGDYSQLEFRVAGFLANDEMVLTDVEAGTDVHSYTASVIGCTRQEAKAHTFKPLYGGVSGTEDQQRYYRAFKDKYRGVTEWHKVLQKDAVTKKEITCRLVDSTPSPMPSGLSGVRLPTVQLSVTILFRDLPRLTYCRWL